PLISVLYSSIFGFTCEELAQIRILGTKLGTESFCEAFLNCAGSAEGTGSELTQKCAAALSRIREWKSECTTMPLPDFIWKIYRETGMYIFMGALPDGEQRQSNLRMLVNRAIAFSKEGSGLYNFLQEIEAGKNKSKVPPAGTVGESANAVHMTTIHRSKGLEYPCVIVAQMQKQIKGKSTEKSFVKFNKSVGMAFDYVEPDGSFTKTTIMQMAIDSRNSFEDIAERIRLLYVAFTRAIKHLVISGYVKKMDKELRDWQASAPLNPTKALVASTYLDWIMPTLKGVVPFEAVPAADLAGGAGEEKTENAPAKLLEGAEGLAVREEIAKRLSYKYPYEADVNSKSKYSVSELNFEGDRAPIELDVPSSLGQIVVREGLTAEDAAERGTIYHKVMELIDFTDLSSADPKAIIEDLRSRGFIEESGMDRIDVAEIDGFLASDLAKRMERAAKAGKLWKEAPFTLRTEKDGREIFVQGIIDCYFAEDGEYVLADYKTNYVEQKSEEVYNHFREVYGEQINLYTKAIEELRGAKVKERFLVMLSAGEAINL
ncbi:MAG: PD-(D/E)XK nuclease family protein, partial [Firmicutes bacterium]|nr:PD-(D/E)XK nuclease family protein [Bacillota bacterium]